MAFMDWDSSLSIGVQTMDSEHRGLIEAMNTVFDLDTRNAGKDRVDAAIVHLAKLTTQHFADEEKYMASINFPELRTHAFIHKNMLEKFTELHTAFRAGGGKVAKEFYDFLKLWLRSHICGIDRKYASHGKPLKPAKV